MNKKKAFWMAPVFLLLVALVLLLMPQAASANVRTEDGGQVPFYARVERGLPFTDGNLVPIIFYRPPECIPAAFNLLDFFDFTGAWGCQPATTDGFGIWKNDPATDPAPIMTQLHGLGAVPVWFVSWQEYQAAIADNMLTIGELASLPSLQVGTASFYNEMLHPSGGAIHTHLSGNAHGALADGTAFQVHFAFTESNANVSISIGS